MTQQLSIMVVTFKRTETAPQETGVIINEGSGPIIDMEGNVVKTTVYNYWTSPTEGSMIIQK